MSSKKPSRMVRECQESSFDHFGLTTGDAAFCSNALLFLRLTSHERPSGLQFTSMRPTRLLNGEPHFRYWRVTTQHQMNSSLGYMNWDWQLQDCAKKAWHLIEPTSSCYRRPMNRSECWFQTFCLPSIQPSRSFVLEQINRTGHFTSC